jgi:hypothetical protein
VVIAAANARHEGCAKACLEGLSERSKVTGKALHYIHVRFPIHVQYFPSLPYSNFSHALFNRRLVLL